MLDIRGLDAWYRRGIPVLRGIDLSVMQGEIVSVVGANGAGKSTLVGSIMNRVSHTPQAISFRGTSLDAVPGHRIVHLGISVVPEMRRIFPNMSVRENLLLGAVRVADPDERRESLKFVFERFQRLAERSQQLGGSLSGGEQQMLAIARGLMAKPDFLILDEPTLGLAPLIIKEVFGLVAELREEGLTILLLEQNAKGSLGVADRGLVLERGAVVLEGPAGSLLADEYTREAYLGI